MLTDNDLKSYINGYYQDRKMSYTKLDKHDRAIGVLLEENEKLHSIIKEVREYITSRARKAGVELMPREKELLEILDKGE